MAEIAERFGTTAERKRLLLNFLDFRQKIRDAGMMKAFQWVDGSFVEDVENGLGRPPKDIDVFTVCWGYKDFFFDQFVLTFPEFSDRAAVKRKYNVDHLFLDADHDRLLTIDFTRFVTQLFSHNRNQVWKGILKIDVDTPNEDAIARKMLGGELS